MGGGRGEGEEEEEKKEEENEEQWGRKTVKKDSTGGERGGS